MTDDRRKVGKSARDRRTMPPALPGAFAHPTVCPPHPSRSGALTQPGQDLEAGIAVGGSQADFLLEIPHRALGVAADPAIAPVGVEAEPGEAELQFLHLAKRHQPFAAWERMHERA